MGCHAGWWNLRAHLPGVVVWATARAVYDMAAPACPVRWR